MAVAEKPLYYFTIHEAQQLIRDRKLSPVELTQAVLDRIAAATYGDQINVRVLKLTIGVQTECRGDALPI